MTSFPETLPALLADKRQRFGSRTALREKELGVWEEVSWSGYYDHVKFCALGFLTLGLQKGDKVAILGDNCREWLYADLAAQAAGGTAVGVYPTNPPKQVEYVLDHSDSVLVVVRDQEQTDKVLEVKASLPKLKKIIVMDMKGLRHYRDPDTLSFSELEALGKERDKATPGFFEELLGRIRPEDVALMVYTSGTTGPPKGAMLTHSNLVALARGFSQVTEMRSDDQVVSYLPLSHIAERLVSLILALQVGYTVNFAESIDTVQESLYEIAPTVFVAVPRIWEKMHAAIQIRMKDASWLKRSIYGIWIPLGRKMVDREIRGEAGSWRWTLLRDPPPNPRLLVPLPHPPRQTWASQGAGCHQRLCPYCAGHPQVLSVPGAQDQRGLRPDRRFGRLSHPPRKGHPDRFGGKTPPRGGVPAG